MVQAHLFARRLDGELATGADAAGTPARAARAQRLTSPRFRLRVAQGLVNAVGRAPDSRASVVFSAAIPVQAAQVREARGEIERLVTDLRDPGPARAQGVALAHRLLTDGAGPLFAPAPSGTLRSAAWTAADRLRDGP